jgi:hypothetical protein
LNFFQFFFFVVQLRNAAVTIPRTNIAEPGVMEAGLTDDIFWLEMIMGLAAGFVAALPVNYIMIARGMRYRRSRTIGNNLSANSFPCA